MRIVGTLMQIWPFRLWQEWRFEQVTAKARAAYGDTVDGLSTRQYANDEEYVTHQRSKLAADEAKWHRLSVEKDRERKFADHFTDVMIECDISGSVLCLGARLGDEVRAFRRCGFPATGVDLNPGTDNKDVEAGDFHALRWKDGEFAGAYTNVLDHVLYLDKFLGEIQRVVRPGGWVFFDIAPGYLESGAVDKWGACLWKHSDDVVAKIRTVTGGDVLMDRKGGNRTLVIALP